MLVVCFPNRGPWATPPQIRLKPHTYQYRSVAGENKGKEKEKEKEKENKREGCSEPNY